MKNILFIFAIVCALYSLTRAAALDDQAVGMQPGQWKELVTSTSSPNVYQSLIL